MAASLQRGAEDWTTLLGSLAQLHVAGASVDWAGFDADYPRRKVSLPTYPFQRQRYWVPEPLRRPTGGAHPLLGPVTRSAAHEDFTFETTVSPAEPRWLGEHRLNGTAVFPAAAYLEAALAATREAWPGHGVVLEQIEFRQAMLLSGDASRTVQTILTPAATGSADWRMYSRNGDASWTLHCQARTRSVADAAPSIEAPAIVRARCAEAIAVESLYEAYAESGVEYDAGCRGLVELQRGGSEAIGRALLTREHVGERHDYVLHPVLIDACLQVCGGSLATTAVHVPFALEQLHFYDPAAHLGESTPGKNGKPVTSTSLWCRARLRSDATEQTPTFDLELTSESGQVVLAMTRLSLRRVERTAQPANIADWLYDLTWQPCPREGGVRSAEFLAAPSQVAERLAAEAVPALAHATAEYQTLLPDLEALAADYVVAALQQLGVAWSPGRRLSIETLAAETGLVGRQRRLAGRLLEILHEDGYLRRVDGDFEVAQPLPSVAPRDRLARILDEHPAGRAEALLLSRCGEQLAAVLRGECEPLALLFPPEGGLSAETMYRDSAAARAFNLVTAQAVKAALEQLPAGRRLRVLEIGAGTGGTTAAVLSQLPADRTDYLFTDVSAAFLTSAREKFAGHDFIEYRTLDIERDPVPQGLPAHGYDLVLAANVLHATADVRRTLGHVRQLLAPLGLLVLLEATRPQRWVDLIFGLLEGWWKFTDNALRPSHPLLPASAWQRLLHDEGFVESACLPADDAAGQAIVVARGPTTALPTAVKGRWLLLADQGGSGRQLADHLTRLGGDCVLAEAPAHFEVLPGGGYRLDPTQADHFDRLLDALNEDATALQGIVHLWASMPCPRTWRPWPR